jgi:SOS-response transcriptional repressor LexA
VTPKAFRRLPKVNTPAGTGLVGPHGLTPRQVRVMELIGEGVAIGRPPTLRELCRACGISSPNGMKCHLQALEKKGVIRLDKPAAGVTARGIEIVGLSDLVAAIVRRHVRTLTHGEES